MGGGSMALVVFLCMLNLKIKLLNSAFIGSLDDKEVIYILCNKGTLLFPVIFLVKHMFSIWLKQWALHFSAETATFPSANGNKHTYTEGIDSSPALYNLFLWQILKQIMTLVLDI